MKRAQVRMIDDYCDLHAYPALVRCYIKTLKKEEITEDDKKSLAQVIKRLADYLGKKNYMVDQFSLADCSVMPVISTLEAYGFTDIVNASQPVKDYAARLKARAGYKGADMIKLEKV